ncbi:uncharacterized protein LOC113522090 [Galleria mellonella]|uniref:Uncharacterized protein LOC113522090 n=1 Tax=Galleria mellonella TaxID=7137 RepID=A0ABM3MD53_GALME|nr:uncharacterized protein LOC113522090 [Galleria mellonella]
MPRTGGNVTCAACPEVIRDDDFIICRVERCHKKFHLLCTNATNLPLESVKSWICPDCKAITKRGGDNSSTPVRSTASPSNVTIRKATRRNGDQSNDDDTYSIVNEMRLLRETMTEFKNELSEVVAAVARCHLRLDDIVDKLTNTEARLQSLEDSQRECDQLKQTVEQLQRQLDIQAQSSLGNEVEIIGLEEVNNENPYHLTLVTASKIGIHMTEGDIDSVARTGFRRTNGDGKENKIPRPLVVRFTRKAIREDFLRAAKSRRDLNSKDIVLNSPERKIFINERLTRANRQLFRDARIRAKEADFKYCWTRNGSIYVRKRTGKPAVYIASYDDLLCKCPVNLRAKETAIATADEFTAKLY